MKEKHPRKCLFIKRATKRSFNNKDIGKRKVTSFILDIEEDEVGISNNKKTKMKLFRENDFCLFEYGRIWGDKENVNKLREF